jgi:hypothetical protein
VLLLCVLCRGDLVETHYTHLYHGSSGPALNLTLEGQLLSQWSSGSPHFDALFLQEVPPVDQLLTSLSGQGPSFTLLVNQSAVSGLPASLNQATSALLRLMVAAGGAKSSPLPSTATASAATPQAVSRVDAEAGGASSTWAGADRQWHASNRTGSILRRFGAVQQAATHSSSPSGVRRGLGDSAVGGGSSGGGHLPSCMPVISTSSSPLPLMNGEKAQRVRQDAGALMLVLCMTLAASVLSASFVVFLVRCGNRTEGGAAAPGQFSMHPLHALWVHSCMALGQRCVLLWRCWRHAWAAIIRRVVFVLKSSNNSFWGFNTPIWKQHSMHRQGDRGLLWPLASFKCILLNAVLVDSWDISLQALRRG